MSSVTVRVVSLVMLAGIVSMVVAGSVIVSQVRSQLFDRAVTSAVDQFEAARASAQSTFGTTVLTAGQIQQAANELIISQYDPVRSIVGAALLRTPNQDETSFQIAEPSTQSSTQIITLISDEMRQAVPGSTGVLWQSVALPNDNGSTSPGIVAGASLELPGAGQYEFYVAYSLENQEETVRLVTGILMAGALVLVLLLALITWLVVGLVLHPVREASQNARKLADGAFDARMRVHGEDELAQLARSFNQMAQSISDQFTRLERMSKVQQDFVSAVSHELRSPVTTIRMAGQLIYDKRDELPAALRRSAELQHDQLINLDTMLSDLLEISRFDAGAMTLATEPSDLADIVRRTIRAQLPLAQSNGVAVYMQTQGDTTAQIEPRRIERIVRNLVVNALEHAESRPVRIRVVGGPTAVAVEVSDNGIGLTDEQVAHVFDRFWRADTARVRKSGGTGLGLTIAREDALLHGGRLQCAGELGLGATFLLAVPREVGQTWTSPLPLRVAAAEESWNDDSLWERIGDDDGTARGAEEGAPPLTPEIGRVKRELSETGSIRVASREAQRPSPDAMSAPEAAGGEMRDALPTAGADPRLGPHPSHVAREVETPEPKAPETGGKA
jgi:two-component system sensor histidine kinase MtrB